ncbi:hypothetical protein D9M71_164750 [compost metagenome]
MAGDAQAAAQDPVELARLRRVRLAGAQRMVVADDGGEQRLDPGTAAQRANVVDALVAEDHATDAVAGVEGHPGGDRSQLRGGRRLEAALRAEIHAHALVHQQQGRPVALLGEGAHERLAVAQRGFRIDMAQVVAGDVVAQFVEAQPASAQARCMVAGKHAGQRLARDEAEPAGALLLRHQLGQRHVDEAIGDGCVLRHGALPFRPESPPCRAGGRSPGRRSRHRPPRRRTAAGDGAAPDAIRRARRPAKRSRCRSARRGRATPGPG